MKFDPHASVMNDLTAILPLIKKTPENVEGDWIANKELLGASVDPEVVVVVGPLVDVEEL